VFYDSLITVQPKLAKAHVVIYSRPGCHLCDEAKHAIHAAQCGDEYTLDEINIESDPHLLRQYQFDIPVVTIDGIEAFRHKLTSAAFREQLLTKSGGKPTFPTRS
jgi:glutaredoxin